MRNSWPVKKLGEVAEINPKKAEVNGISDSIKVSFIPMQDVDDEDGKIIDNQVRKLGDVKKGYTYFKNNDVLFAKITPCMQNGKFAIARMLKNGIGFGSTEFHVIRPSNQILSEWIYLLIRQKSFRGEAEKHMTGTAGQQRVPKEYLENLEIPVPGIEEQRRIVKKLEKILSRISDANSLRQELLEETKLILASAINQYFSKTNTGKEKLREVAILERGKFTPRPRNDPSYFGGSTPWIQIGEVTDRDGKYINSYSGTLNERGVAVSKVFPAGTAVVSIAASIGTVGILNFDSAFPDSLIGIQGKEVLNDYVYYYLQFMQSHLDYIAPQSAQKNINLRILGDLEIPVPDLKDQEKIVAYLDGLSEKVRILRQAQDEQLQELEALQQSVLHQAFQGRS